MLLRSISCINFFRCLILAALMLTSHWAAADSAETALMPGKVIEGHAKYEEECKNCHKRFDKGAQTGLCLDCHKETAADVRSHKGYHGRLKDEDKECRTCHTDHKGRNAKIVIFDKTSFKHDETGFILEDKHKTAKCEGCHKPKLKYRETPSKCDSCHQKDDVHKGKLGLDCGSCHNAKDWKKSSFDHEKAKFKLAGGKHADVKCEKCHFDKALKLDKTFKEASKECNSCHRKDDQAKGHKGRYGEKCETCHNDRGWKEIHFDHDKETKYVLRDKHIQVKCDACHLPAKPLYKQNLLTTCVACHRKDDKEKGHQGKLGDKCESCHSEKSWKTTNFDHDKDTKYPLKGKHRDAKCDTCHKSGVAGIASKKALEKLDTACVSCHRKDDQEKGHKGTYGAKCESCHTEQDWKTLVFDHTRDTKYTLKEKHVPVKCKSCHAPEKQLYGQKLETTCVSCHRKVDQEKAHKGTYGVKCESCHTEKDWKTLTFDHTRDTKYPLRDKHVPVKCKSCHLPDKQLYGQKLETTCISCHRKDDKHKDQLGTKCETCHTEESWNKTRFNHQTMSKYPLLGRHALVSCKKCHAAPTYKDASKECFGCHEKDDKHKRRLGTECQTCHTARSWQAWDFDHNKTGFKLDGPHKKVAGNCYDCHQKPMGKKVLAPTACGSCHDREDVHNGSFGDRCDRCHEGNDWKQVKMGTIVPQK